MSVTQLIVGAFVTIITAVGGWIVTVLVRRDQSASETHAKSGTVRTSEAADLWAEATKMREYLRDELHDRDIEIATLQLAVDDCKKRSELCERRERILERRIAVLEAGEE